MKHSYHAEYLAIERRSRWMAGLWAVFDLLYYFGLLGGIIGSLASLLWWPLDLLRGTARPWHHYLGSTALILGIAIVLVLLAVAVLRWIPRRLGIPPQPNMSLDPAVTGGAAPEHDTG